MILIVGGIASGKRTLARSLGFVDAQMADAVLDERPVVYNAQDLVSCDMTPERVRALADALADKSCVISCEVGSGVVPVDVDERRERELAGRLAIELAARARVVIRVVCGLPVPLKGRLEGLRGGGAAPCCGGAAGAEGTL